MRKLIIPLLLAVLLLTGFVVSVDAQSYYQKFENIWAKSLLTSGNATIGGDLTVTGATISMGSVVAVGTQGISGDLNVTDDVVIADTLTVSGVTNLVGNATAAGTFAVNGNSLSVAKTLNLARQTSIAVTEGAIITPTGTFQELTAAGGVTATLADPAAAGQTVILFNSTSNAITIADGSGRYFAGNVVLGSYDNVTLISTAAGSWMEISRSDN